MSRKLGLILPILLISAVPAFAQTSSCGSVPFAPAMPAPADMKTKAVADAETALHDAFSDIRNWQGDLKTYRSCLEGQGNQAKADMGGLDKTKDADKIAALKQQQTDSNHLFDSSVDQEEKVVNEFHASQAAYCSRADANKSKCPK
jgi:hypothetical protein